MTIEFKPANGYSEEEVILPKRQTLGSNGYDFYASKDITIPRYHEGQRTIVYVPTGITACFPKNVVLLLFNRSSNPGRYGLVIPNGVGVVDSDYSEGTHNEIKGMFLNMGYEDVHIKRGDRVFQGVFVPSLLTSNDNPVDANRDSGFGSTSGKSVDQKVPDVDTLNLTHNAKVVLSNYYEGHATADYELAGTTPFLRHLREEDSRGLTDLGYDIVYQQAIDCTYIFLEKKSGGN